MSDLITLAYTVVGGAIGLLRAGQGRGSAA
jgi:hypothetical protein